MTESIHEQIASLGPVADATECCEMRELAYYLLDVYEAGMRVKRCAIKDEGCYFIADEAAAELEQALNAVQTRRAE